MLFPVKDQVLAWFQGTSCGFYFFFFFYPSVLLFDAFRVFGLFVRMAGPSLKRVVSTKCQCLRWEPEGRKPSEEPRGRS